jgi:hypothetical protein
MFALGKWWSKPQCFMPHVTCQLICSSEDNMTFSQESNADGILHLNIQTLSIYEALHRSGHETHYNTSSFNWKNIIEEQRVSTVSNALWKLSLPANQQVISCNPLVPTCVFYIYCDWSWICQITKPTFMWSCRLGNIICFFNIWCSYIDIQVSEIKTKRSEYIFTKQKTANVVTS